MKKLFVIMIILLMGMLVFCNYSCAYDATKIEEDASEDSQEETQESSIDDLGDLSQYKGLVGNPTKFTEKAQRIVGVVQTIGVVVSVVVLIGIGIKYMLGSVEERADYKRTLLPYVIGAVLVFSISTLPQLIYDVMQAF